MRPRLADVELHHFVPLLARPRFATSTSHPAPFRQRTDRRLGEPRRGDLEAGVAEAVAERGTGAGWSHPDSPAARWACDCRRSAAGRPLRAIDTGSLRPGLDRPKIRSAAAWPWLPAHVPALQDPAGALLGQLRTDSGRPLSSTTTVGLCRARSARARSILLAEQVEAVGGRPGESRPSPRGWSARCRPAP